jgi:hypothetical protein
MTPEADHLIEELAASHPSLRVALTLHREAWDGAVVPYDYLSEVLQWAVRRYLQGEREVVANLFSLLERLYEMTSEQGRELIAVGVVENMPHSTEQGGGMRDLLGPLLAREYELLNF